MNFGQMKKFCRLQAGDDVDPTKAYFGNETMALFMNANVAYVASLLQPTRTYVDTDTTAYDNPLLAPDANEREGRYALDPSIVAIKGIHLFVGTERRQLTWLPFDDFEQRYGLTNLAGTPEAYRDEFGHADQSGSAPGDIWLGPMPNAVFTLRMSVFTIPTEIAPTDDAKTYELPRELHPCVCYLTLVDMMMRNDDSSRAQKFQARFEKSFAGATTVTGRRNRTGEMSTQPKFARSKSYTRRVR